MVQPDVIVIAHTATSYHLGSEAKRRCWPSCGKEAASGSSPRSARYRNPCAGSGSTARAGRALSAEVTLQGKAHLEANGFEVVNFANLPDVTNIYELTAEHAYKLARSIDSEAAQAAVPDGTGMPTFASAGKRSNTISASRSSPAPRP
jgi:hypothetical protein